MRGHVRKHGKGWVVVVDVGRDGDGKRQQRWHSGYRTKSQAEGALPELLTKLQSGDYVEPKREKVTVTEYLRSTWLPYLDGQVAMGDRRASSAAQYRNLCEAHIIPRIGNVQLRSLTASALDRLYSDLAKSGRKVRREGQPAGLSASTVRAVAVTCSAFLSHAVRKGALNRNVAQQTDRLKTVSREQAIWTPEELERFLTATKTDRLYPLWVLALGTGLRRAELAALTWADIDLDIGSLTVCRARVVVGYRVVEGEPKTGKSRRTIALGSGVVAVLKAHRTRQKAEMLAWGQPWTTGTLVFTAEGGTAYHPQRFTQAFQRAAKRADVPILPLHACRHLHATNGLRAGVDLLTMSRRLGHSSISVTGDVYSHVVEKLDREAAEATASLLLAPGPSVTA